MEIKKLLKIILGEEEINNIPRVISLFVMGILVVKLMKEFELTYNETLSLFASNDVRDVLKIAKRKSFKN